MERITRLVGPSATDTPVKPNTCDTCAHFCRVNGQEECHAHPPTAMPAMDPTGTRMTVMGFFAPILKDPGGRFCGEWKENKVLPTYS